MDDHGDVTLAEAYGVDLDEISALPEFVLGQERPRYRFRRLCGGYRSAPELDDVLGPYEQDLRAGVPARLVGKRLGLSPSLVTHWRRSKGIDRQRGPASRASETTFMARTLIANARPAVPHQTGTISQGMWSIPEYVLRAPLHYDTFVDAVGVLVDAGMEVERIAGGLGVAVRDVLIALEVHDREAAT